MHKEKKQNWYTNPRKYHFIYKTTCQVNGKYYYGMHSTDDLEDGYIGSGTQLWHSIKKYGKENFKIEILEFCPDRESLKKREAELITEEVLAEPMCMNLTLGGGCGWDLINKNSKFKSAGGLKTGKINIVTARKHIQYSKNLKERWETNRDKLLQILEKAIKAATSESSKLKRKETFKKKKHQQGEKNTQYGKSWMYCVWLSKNITVPKELIPEYIDTGWIKGRKIFK